MEGTVLRTLNYILQSLDSYILLDHLFPLVLFLILFPSLFSFLPSKPLMIYNSFFFYPTLLLAASTASTSQTLKSTLA